MRHTTYELDEHLCCCWCPSYFPHPWDGKTRETGPARPFSSSSSPQPLRSGLRQDDPSFWSSDQGVLARRQTY